MADRWHDALPEENELDILTAGRARFPIWYWQRYFQQNQFDLKPCGR